uniref:Uncharacterized protein n=1 Tax=Arion vulgaris TaxID=1028688 RepID=A0A0B6Z6A0_9EUPU
MVILMIRMSQKVQTPSSRSENSTQTISSNGDSITNNGGFIAMAACLSIVVPLVCVLLIQLRKAKKAERARSRAGERPRESGTTSQPSDPISSSTRDPVNEPIRNPIIDSSDIIIDTTSDLPPPYEQVFGPNFTVSPSEQSIYNSMTILIQDNEFSHSGSGNIDNESESRLTNVLRSQTSSGIANIGDYNSIRERNQIILQESVSIPVNSNASESNIRLWC